MCAASDDIYHTCRNTHVTDDFCEDGSSHRSFLGRLKNSGTTGSDDRTDFPCCHDQRKVPRDDLSADTHWFIDFIVM